MMKIFSTGKISTAFLLAGALLAIWLFAGCSGGTGEFTGDCSPDNTGAFRMSVAWPGEPLPDGNAKYIPSQAKKIEVNIGKFGSSDYYITTDIVYPVSTIAIDNIPQGNWVATIKAFDETKSTLYSQRKESFEIIMGETTKSGNMPLGVAITGTTANPVFQPTAYNIPMGSTYVFQNWLEKDYALSVAVTGATTQNYGLSAASSTNQFPQATHTVTLPQDTRTASFSLAGNPSAVGSGTVLYNAPLQPYWVNVADLIPKSSNGTNGVYCRYGTSGTINLANTTDYRFYITPGTYAERQSSTKFELRVCYEYGNDKKNSWLIVPLNGGFKKFKVTGGVSASGGGGTYVRPYIYHNGTQIWTSSTTSGTFTLEREYSAEDVLKFRNTTNSSFGGTCGIYFTNVKIIGIP